MADYNRYREEENLDNSDNLEKSDKENNEEVSKVDNEAEDVSENSEKADINSDKKKFKSFKKEIHKLKERILALEQENNDLKNANLMVKADEINFKKRIEQEKDTLVKYGNQKLLEKIVNELDLFDKVVSMPTDDPTLKNYLIGFEMINNNLKGILESEGVKKIKVSVGDKFDPKYHHVLQTEWDENYEEDTILAELKSGYMYKDRVLCTTLVKINKKESK